MLITSPPIGHTSPILCASFSPTGNLLATGSGDCNARLWDLFTETPSHVLSGHNGWVLCVEWEAMERKLATGGHDGHVSHRNYPLLNHFDRPATISNLGPSFLVPPNTVLFDSSCVLPHLFYCFSLVLQVRLWVPKTGKPIGEPLKGHSKWVTSLAWEPIHLCVYISSIVRVFDHPWPLCFGFVVQLRIPSLDLVASDPFVLHLLVSEQLRSTVSRG